MSRSIVPRRFLRLVETIETKRVVSYRHYVHLKCGHLGPVVSNRSPNHKQKRAYCLACYDASGENPFKPKRSTHT